MSFEFLTPVSDSVINYAAETSDQSLARQIQIYSASSGFPELSSVQIVLFGIRENRNAAHFSNAPLQFDMIRKSFYALYAGNWQISIADIGDILAGDEVSDTYYLVQQVTSELLKKNIIPILLGGTQDLVYAQYRAFDALERMVNIVNVDHKFDLGNSAAPITNTSYIGKIIVEKPYNLFNYSTLGYQTYEVPQEEVDLMEKLYFDAYRLGEVIEDIKIVEPIMRDADLVSIDLGSVQAAALGFQKHNPNGFNGREICAISRYAGISDKVKSFGIFEFESFDNSKTTSMLVAQILWYFMEGVNYRTHELNIKNEPGTLHYNVPVENDILSFYKSPKTQRWWIEIPFVSSGNNKLKRHTLLPCTYNDYERACNQEIPERWYKAKRKNEV